MGSYEVLQDNSDYGASNKYARQMMLGPTVSWCQADTANKSLNVIGQNWWGRLIKRSVLKHKRNVLEMDRGGHKLQNILI